MAGPTLTKKCFQILSINTRATHTSSKGPSLSKNGVFPPQKSALHKYVAPKRWVQSIAKLNDVSRTIDDESTANKDCGRLDPISIGAKQISTDPSISGVTLGQLREAKYRSQNLLEKISRWIWEGESWSIFVENNIQITKVKLLPNFETLRIHWSATGIKHMDEYIQDALDQMVSMDIKERMESQEGFKEKKLPLIEFIADYSQNLATVFATGRNNQHPNNSKPTKSEMMVDKRAMEHEDMKIFTGISTLKALEPVTVNGGFSDFNRIEDDITLKSEIKGLDYHSLMKQILQNPTLDLERF